MNVIKSALIRSNFYKRRQRFAFIVKKRAFDNLEITQIDNILEDVIRDCKDE